MGLDMAGGSLETGGAFVQGAVDTDVPELPTLEASFVITEMVIREGGIMVAAGPPDFGAFQGGLFFFGQWGQ